MESELKLELDEAGYETLFALREPGTQPVEQWNVFYDTPQRDLRRLQWALRLRREPRRAFLTAKGAAVEKREGRFVRPEYECELSVADAERLATGFRLSDVAFAPAAHLRGMAGDLLVVPVCAFVNYRTRVRYAGQEFDLDRTLIGCHVRYELELEREEEGGLRDWLRSLGIAARASSRSKLAAAEALGGAETPGSSDVFGSLR